MRDDMRLPVTLLECHRDYDRRIFRHHAGRGRLEILGVDEPRARVTSLYTPEKANWPPAFSLAT